MKKLTFMLLMTFPLIVLAQIPNFNITNISEIKPIVIEIDNKTADELYDKAYEWLNFTYKNPQSVIKGSVENDFIRFSGFKKSFSCVNIGMGMVQCYDLKYTMRIDFKKGKYRFSLESYSIVYPPNQYTGSTESTLDNFKDDRLRNKKGELKKDVWKRQYESQSQNLLLEINSINESLYSYQTGQTEKAKDDW